MKSYLELSKARIKDLIERVRTDLTPEL